MARNERERRSVLARLIPTRGGIALRTNEIIYSTRTKSATLDGADNHQRAKTAQRKGRESIGRSSDTFALQSSKIQSGSDGLFPPLRLVEWIRNETLQSLKIAPFCLRSSTEEVSLWKSLRDLFIFFARRGGVKGTTADGFPYPGTLSS